MLCLNICFYFYSELSKCPSIKCYSFPRIDLAQLVKLACSYFLVFVTEESVAALVSVASLQFYVCCGGYLINNCLPQLDYKLSEGKSHLWLLSH